MKTTRQRKVPRSLVAMLAIALVGQFAFTSASQAQQGPTCFGQPVTVDLRSGQVPTPGDDVILGTEGDDIIAAGDGDDIICGWLGNDVIWGQNGNDRISGSDGDDKLRGGAGNDEIFGDFGQDDVAGGPGNDHVVGGQDDDPKVRGGTGDDLVEGGSGNDALIAGNGGSDIVVGWFGDDKLTGGPRPDELYGGWGDDELRGHKGADFMVGDAGDDMLYGGPQADQLWGWTGNDYCNGGTTGEGAPEADQASACSEVPFVEGSNVLRPDGSPVGRIIGEGNLGGDLTDLMQVGGVNDLTAEASSSVIQITFVAPAVECFAADGVATAWPTGDGGELIEVVLFRGPPVGSLAGCAGGPNFTHTMVLELSEPVGDRHVQTFEPDAQPGNGVSQVQMVGGAFSR